MNMWRKALTAVFLAVLAATAALAAPHGNAVTNLKSPLGFIPGGVVPYDGLQPFLNKLKMSLWWITNTGESTTITIDSNGYPTAIPGGKTNVQTWIMGGPGGLAAPFYRAGTYVLLFDEAGTPATFSFAGDATSSTPGCDLAGESPHHRYIVNVPTPTNGVQLLITAMGTTYPANMSFIYADTGYGGTASSCLVEGTEEASYIGGAIFNRDALTYLAPFKTLRFVEWMTQNNFNTSVSAGFNWATRPTAAQVFWSKDTGVVYAGGATITGGVPLEIMIALCNQLNADPWFNMYVLSTSSYWTNFFNQAAATLNSNLKMKFENANEVWNFGANPTGPTISAASWSATSGGQATFTTSSSSGVVVGGWFDVANMTPSAYNGRYTAISGTSGTTLVGALASNPGTATVMGTLEGNSVSGYTDYCSALYVQGQIDFPSAPNDSLTPCRYEHVWRTIQQRTIARTAFSSFGGNSRVEAILGGQAAGYGNGSLNFIELNMTNTTGGCSVCTWSGLSGVNVDALGVAPYFNFMAPSAWLSDSDAGLAKMFKETMFGGVLPSSASPITTTGTTGVFAVTTGQGLSNPPPNQAAITVTWNASAPNPTTLAADGGAARPVVRSRCSYSSNNPASPATISISNASPAVVTMSDNRVANCNMITFTSGTLGSPLVLNKPYFVTNFSFGATFNLSLTSGGAAINTTGASTGTINATFIQAALGGFSPDCLEYDSTIAAWQEVSCDVTGGYIAAAVSFLTTGGSFSNIAMANTMGIKLEGYESGQQFTDAFDDDTSSLLYLPANQDSRMGWAYGAYYAALQAAAAGLTAGGMSFNHCCGSGSFGTGIFGNFGLTQNVLTACSPTTPKYCAVRDYISKNPCGWSGCQN